MPNDFVWYINKRRNLEGGLKATGTHYFTWQPHGSQFTIICDVPSHACKFKIKRPPVLDFEEIMARIGFDESYISVLQHS